MAQRSGLLTSSFFPNRPVGSKRAALNQAWGTELGHTSPGQRADGVGTHLAATWIKLGTDGTC